MSFRPNFYDLVLVDIAMPELDGFELYERLKKIDPKQVLHMNLTTVLVMVLSIDEGVFVCLSDEKIMIVFFEFSTKCFIEN